VPATRRRLAAVASAAIAVALLGAPAVVAPPASAASCTDFEIIAVRGTLEPGTVGALSGLAKAITDGTAHSVKTYGLPYPASSDWVKSAQKGINQLAAQLAGQSKACPKQKFVLLGYSQGAWVVGDALAGGGGGVAPAVGKALGKKVAAIILYGDPRFRASEPYTRGTHAANVNGLIPREVGGLKAYASRIRSYCDSDDTICQNGAKGNGHFRYFQTETAKAASFVLSKIGKTHRTPATTPTTVPRPVPTTTPIPTVTAPAPSVTAPAPTTVVPTLSPAPTKPAPPVQHRKPWWMRFLSWCNPFD
jgi:hypothetical protein